MYISNMSEQVFNFELWQTLACDFKRIVFQITIAKIDLERNENKKNFL